MAGWIAATLQFTTRTGRRLAVPFLALPMGIFSISITLWCCWFLISYVLCCVSWWTFLACLGFVWRLLTGKPHPREAKRQSLVMPDSLRKMNDVNAQRRMSQPQPQPQRRQSVCSSRECLVGAGTDRDFEGLGGWALSTDDDEALYMAKSFGQEPCFDDVTLSAPRYRRSASQSSGLLLPSGPPSPILTRPPTGYGMPRDDDRIDSAFSHHSRSSSPGTYFNLPPSRSTASLQRLRVASPHLPEYHRQNSSFLGLNMLASELRDAATPGYDARVS